MAARQPDIARFGAAILRDAEEERADDTSATYGVRARWREISAFYQAVYDSQAGIEVRVLDEEDPPSIVIAAAPQVDAVDFASLVVQPHPDGEPHRYQIIVIARGEAGEDDDDYPDSSPWAEPV